ncbi:Thoeris anti-defense Tad2 family protein, partial [Xenorhabdus innexi]
MSDVNKLDNTALPCPLNPNEYKSNEIAPIGSFPWAMIQVYLGRRVNRHVWNEADAYISLRPASGGLPPLLSKYDKKDGITIWTPTADDMMGCDWVLLKSDSKPDIKCPFNPTQYNLAAITGSLPWALIQVYLGSKVSRSSWNSSYEYIYLVQKSDVSSGGEKIAHIEKMFESEKSESWTPEQEDLMACDWKLLVVYSA